MITTYRTGAEFWVENCGFLNTNPYLSVFFKLDCPLLTAADKTNYALQCTAGGKQLLALKVEPFNLLLFGEADCIPELISFILDNGYELKHYLCSAELGGAVMQHLREAYGIRYEEGLAMDFMEATEVTEPSSPEVTAATEQDLDEIFACLKRFIADCGLLDQPDREHTRETIGAFRVIRENGRIVSMAKLSPSTGADVKLAAVYTRDEARGKGYARNVVNAAKNEILSSGKVATLNVDRHNPASNHLYASLGFRRVFSQGEYRRAD